MEDLAQSAERVAEFMRNFTTEEDLRLKFRITAGAGAADPTGLEHRDIFVEIKGPDAELLTENDGDWLHSVERDVSRMLAGLGVPYRVSFDADGFKAARVVALRSTAAEGIEKVSSTGEPYHFQQMNPRERRLLHMFLLEAENGMQTASSGEGASRHVVLYPEGAEVPVEVREPRRDFNRGRSNDRGGNRDRGRGNDRGGRGRY